jgi:hypothetical protein
MTWIAIQARFTLIVKTCKHMCNQATQAINKRSIKIFKIFCMQQVCKCSLCSSSPYGVKNVPYQGKGQNHIDIPSWLDLVASMGDMLAHMQSGFKISNPPRFHLHLSGHRHFPRFMQASPTVHAHYST